MIKYLLVALTAGFLFTGSVNAQSTDTDGTVVVTDNEPRQEK